MRTIRRISYVKDSFRSRRYALRHVRNARQRRCAPHRGSKESEIYTHNRTEVVAEDSVNTALIKEAIAKQGYGVGRIETQPYEKHGLFSHKR